MTSNTSNTFEKNEIISNVLIVSPIFNIGDVVKHKLYQFRGVIVYIDPEFSNTDEWYQDSSNGWQLTTESYSSPTYSYNSPDDNNSGELTTHSLYSEQITLPNLVDGEILQYSFSLNCKEGRYF